MRTYLKKNKALLILPLLLLPFVILIFYILGGGEKALNQKVLANQNDGKEGANYILPEAERNIVIFDKMEAYQQQDLAVQMGNENSQEELDSAESRLSGSERLKEPDSLLVLLKKGSEEDISEPLLAHIRQKQELMKGELEKEASREEFPNQKKIQKRPVKEPFTDMHQEKELTRSLLDSETGLEELEQVFEENSRLNQENDSLKFDLELSKRQLSLLKEEGLSSFNLEQKEEVNFNGKRTSHAMIRAEIYESSKVLDGNRIKMRLLEDAWLNGQKVSGNTFLYGICKINNERLHIRVSSFPIADYFLPVDLQIHDLDGLPGLYIPDNAARKVSKEVGSRTNASTLWGMSSDPLANMGISAADQTTQILLKRVRLKKISIKKNTLVYLINQNQQP
ncbi:conjugative transposon protein TraM [Labilibaculum sp. A4]|uniref:conjugative transposon protein TraM n=1 Tax=Labilibaculum euxinus TaxID=2686357 RepID=UPI000F6214BE|nr:conjugative transposon protein TraM [Labilibaculum euxinus]MDQ1769308.1 conjugative transposon protein TraM [Labilibaculum euxinus]MWN74833.1 conjugative transposon protein TraM [Labilibaculum euxinus]